MENQSYTTIIGSKKNDRAVGDLIARLLLLLVFFAAAGPLRIQAQEKKPATLYLYGFVNTRDDKSAVFSPTISVRVKDNTQHTRTLLVEQFKDYLKKYIAGEMGIDIRVEVTGASPSVDRQLVENERLGWMKRSRETYKLSIIHTGTNFYFRFNDPVK